MSFVCSDFKEFYFIKSLKLLVIPQLQFNYNKKVIQLRERHRRNSKIKLSAFNFTCCLAQREIPPAMYSRVITFQLTWLWFIWIYQALNSFSFITIIGRFYDGVKHFLGICNLLVIDKSPGKERRKMLLITSLVAGTTYVFK